MQVNLTPVDETVHHNEVKEWLLAFHSNASVAIAHIPNPVYSLLLAQGLLCADLTLSPSGLSLLGV